MKIFRLYIIAVLVCFSITSVTACIFVADENARRISLGSESAVAVVNSSDEELYENAVNLSDVLIKIKNAAEKAASIAPPPLSNIYWLIINAESLLN